MVQAPAVDAVKESGALLTRLREEAARPVEVVHVGARGDELQIDAVARHRRREAAVFGGVLLGREVTAAAPGLVADAPEAHAERVAARRLAARAPFRAGGRTGGRVDVLDPVEELLRAEAAEVRGQVGFRAGQLAEAQEFVRPEVVGLELPGAVGRALRPLGRVHPEVGAARAAGARPGAVAPVVAVGEAAAGPADDRRLDALQRLDERRADAARVRHARVLADPDAVVDDAAEVFGEVAVDVAVDGADLFADEDFDARVGGARGTREAGARARREQTGTGGDRAADKFTSLFFIIYTLPRVMIVGAGQVLPDSLAGFNVECIGTAGRGLAPPPQSCRALNFRNGRWRVASRPLSARRPRASSASRSGA